MAETPEFNEWLHRAYPRGASEWPEGQSRRDFRKLMAASFALAGMTACTRQPQEKILLSSSIMEVRYSPPMGWLFATAGFVWRLLLLIFTQSDYQTRAWSGQNWRGGTNGQDHIEFNNPGSARP